MTVGTNRKCLVDDLPYDVASDADFNQTIAEFENSLIVTSGKNVIKQEKQSQKTEDIVLVTTAAQREALRRYNDSGDNGAHSYTDAAGVVYRIEGQINIGSHQTMEGKTTISFLPVSPITVIQ